MGSLPELNFVKCKAFIPIEYIDFLITLLLYDGCITFMSLPNYLKVVRN